MKKVVSINSVNELKRFVNESTKVDGDVICYRDPYRVNGKSILGLMSIDIADGFVVEFPCNAVDFVEYLASIE